MNPLDTVAMRAMIVRFRSGEVDALSDLIERTTKRLEKIARRMLRDYTHVRQLQETSDLLQGSLIRLTRALSTVMPESVVHFYELATEQVRLELKQLNHQYRRMKPKNDSSMLDTPQYCLTIRPEVQEDTTKEADYWQDFYTAFELLDDTEKRVFGLAFYNGYTQMQVGEMLDISERQIRRYWASAVARIRRVIKRDLPAIG